MTNITKGNQQEQTNNAKSQLDALVIPHLYIFANGMFGIRYYDKTGGYNADFTIETLYELRKFIRGEKDYGKISLIARPISDMNKTEVCKTIKIKKSSVDDVNFVRNRIKSSYRRSDLDSYQLLYLISIGVYPFDQDDFEAEWLIDSSAL